MIAFKGHIYICFQNSAFLYKLNDQGELEEFAACNQIVKKPTLFASNDFLYLISENGMGTHAERFRCRAKKWTELSWGINRNNIKLASIGPKLYICGGNDDSGEISNFCFMYDEKMNCLTQISSMLIERKDFQLVAYGGKLYAIGGRNQYNIFVDYMEEYCPLKDEWKLLPTSSQIQGDLHGAGVVTIKD